MMRFATYTSYLYTVIFNISFCCWLVFEIWNHYRNREAVSKRIGRRSNQPWNIIALIIGIGLAFNLPQFVPQGDIKIYFAGFFVLGIALIWTGIFFRYQAIRTLGKFFSTKLVIQDEHRLITEGLYKRLRHPSYTGALLTLTGIGLAIGNVLSPVLLIAVGLLAYYRRIKTEEGILERHFGQAYRDYKKRTWALIPYLW